MADITNLSNFLTDIASAIRSKKGTTEPIPAQEFDSEIATIETGMSTSDATATANDIINPKTAYVNGEKITGSIMPTYLPVDASLYAQTNLNISVAPNNWWSLPLGDYIFYVFRNGSNMYVVAIRDDKVESTASYSLSTLYSNTEVNDVLLTWDSYDDTTYTLCVGKGRNNGDGDTRVWFRRVKYDVAHKTFSLIDGIAIGAWGDTGNNYGYGGLGCYTYPNTIAMQYSKWEDYLSLAYAKLNWTETSGSISNLLVRSRTSGFGYGLYETGDGHIFCGNYRLYVMNEARTSMTDVSTSGKAFVSHNCQYMIYGNTLYRVNKNENATTFFNSKIAIQGGLPSYSSLRFTKDDAFAILANGNTIYVIRFDDTGWELYQTLSMSNAAMPFEGQYILGVISGVLHQFKYTAGEMLKALEVQGMKFVQLLPDETVSDPSKLLVGEQYLSVDGTVMAGTMKDNGELTYTPSEEEQTIPAGYTSGGKVQAVDITSLDDYQDCLNIAKTIINIQEPTDKLCEYIESTGSSTQITTDIYVDEMAETVDVTISNPSLNGWAYIIAIGSTRIAEFDSSTFGCWHQNTRSDFRATVVSSTPYILTFTNGAILQNEVTKLSYSKLTSPNSQLLKLFPKFDTASYSRIHKIQIKRADLVIHDLVPVLHIVNDTYMPCIYDKITGKYYFNDYSGNFNYKLAE